MLDEPLAALGVREGGQVLGLIQNLRRQRNVSIILIVHNYNQIFEVCDRINFLHSGEIVLDASTSETSEEELIRIVKSDSVGRRLGRSGGERSRRDHNCVPRQLADVGPRPPLIAAAAQRSQDEWLTKDRCLCRPSR